MFPPASLCNAVLKHLHQNDKHQKSDTDNTSVHSNFLAGLTARRFGAREKLPYFARQK